MKYRLRDKANYVLPVKAIIVMTFILSCIIITTSAFKGKSKVSMSTNVDGVNADSVESAQAFLQVYKVLMSPRCMNCHPAGTDLYREMIITYIL